MIFVLSKQIIRCGTSIGANVNEAQAGLSKRDFIAKMSISSKEARESLYWLKLLKESCFIEYDFDALISKKSRISKNSYFYCQNSRRKFDQNSQTQELATICALDPFNIQHSTLKTLRQELTFTHPPSNELLYFVEMDGRFVPVQHLPGHENGLRWLWRLGCRL